MGRFRKADDAPRVVGFDFSGPAPAPVAPVAAPVAPVAAYPPPLYVAPETEQQPYAFTASVATMPEQSWRTPEGAYPAPLGWTPPPSKRKRGVRVRGGALGTIVAVVVAGRWGYRVYERSALGLNPNLLTLKTPATVGTQPRMTMPEAQALERETRADFASVQQVQVAFYGTTEPVYFFLAGLGTEKSAGEVMREVDKGFTDATASVGKPKSMPGGLTCAPLTLDGEKGGVCAWGGRGSDGAVIRFGSANLTALAKVTVAARTVAEGR